ncbi:type I phosphomannose isomerase catalytic subunit [Hydrogenoanaerobacterium sp.]|uniref:type I phosphomannose isomerase catalytic subunit n=1 Tax=Hydrogenoanaerobacterium sp. TaxID=2953763 RepID=UPI00289B20D0|nr:type I phosphomannose isomerase catalytic subunit [Hydrogenoanaerobacterium sp.]
MQPIKLTPVYKDYLWGGERLKTDYRKQTDLMPLAESWELSCHKDGSSLLGDGSTLSDYVQKHPEAVGTRGAEFAYFPILFKLIDAKGDLSLQVHPDDEYALRVEHEYGKTEIWIVLDCEPGAKLIYGFREKITKEQFRAKIADNTILDVVNFMPVKKGDVFFIEAGTLHGIGKGIVIAEIQQNSNTTYRVYDYGRLDAAGNLRPLHVDKAIDVTNTEQFQEVALDHPVRTAGDCTITTLADCSYFKTERMELDGECTLSVDKGSFTGLFCAEGKVVLESEKGTLQLAKGDTAFLPAGMGAYTLKGKAQLISMGV